MNETRGGITYLPDEIVQPVRPRQLWVTWLAVLAIILACNFVLAPRLLVGGRNLAGWIIGHKWRMLMDLDQPVDDLVLGDSSCNQGVNPVTLARALGDRRAINLCTVGDMLALNDAWMLQTYIERFGAPRRVIIVHVYDIWSRNFSGDRVGAIPVGFLRLRRLQPEVQLERWQLRSYLETRYFPLYSSNLSLKASLRPGDPVLADAPGARRVDSLGFLADTVAFPDSVELDLQGHLKFLKGETYQLSRDNRRGLDRIARLARQHGFDVYLVAAPVYQRLAESESFQAYFARVQQSLAGMAGEGSGLHLVFNQPMAFAATEMQNADHLVLGAANRYTEELARQIQRIEDSTGSANR